MQTETHNGIQTEPSWPIAAEEASDELLDVFLEVDELVDDTETCGLLDEDGVGEVVDSVLDAADVEILGDIGDSAPWEAGGETYSPVGDDGPDCEAARAEARGALLLRQLMVDVLRRYRERKRRELRCQGGGA